MIPANLQITLGENRYPNNDTVEEHMSVVKEDSTITITYECKLDNGHVFKKINEDEPLTLKLGNQELPPTLEKELVGLKEDESKTVRLSPEEGYGARQKILVQDLGRETFGDKITPKPGMILSLKVEKDGEMHQVPATVMEVTEKKVVVDYNHPLAGHHLTYTVTVLKIK